MFEKLSHSTRALTVAVLLVAILWAAGGAVAACTPKREAATVDIVMKKSKCALENLDRTPEQMLIDCAIPKDEKDVQDIIDIFTGAQAAAMKAGAPLPKSHPYRDAGAGL